jgi:hypothetical protein
MEATAAADGKKAASFNKLDFMALVLSKHLHTKASLISYVQGHGSPGAQLFTSKNQRRVMEYIEDAQEWEGHRALACPQTTSRTQTLTPIHTQAYTNTCTHITHAQTILPPSASALSHPGHATGTKRAQLSFRNQIGEAFRCITFAYVAKLSRRSSSTPWPSTVVPVLDK